MTSTTQNFLPMHPDIRRVLAALTDTPESTAYSAAGLVAMLRGLGGEDVQAALRFLTSSSLARMEASPSGAHYRATKRGKEEMLRYLEGRMPSGTLIIARA
jgi:hypothetical protein